ncbi:MAG: hypothetical protein WBV61_12675 [Rhodanobacteraceae bacterium]
MILKSVLAALCIISTAAWFAPQASADTLGMRHARHHHRHVQGNMPTRGLTMAQVERRYGVPLEKLPTAGGDAPKHPPINRWRYAGYTVYFERNIVIHSVMNEDLADRRSVR